MNVGVIANGVVINAALFAGIDTAQQLLNAGVWPGADNVIELPDGYGIGDTYADGVWSKAPSPAPEPTPAYEDTYTVDDYLLDLDYRLSLLELEGGV